MTEKPWTEAQSLRLAYSVWLMLPNGRYEKLPPHITRRVTPEQWAMVQQSPKDKRWAS